jgi:ribonuclease BN (tRNA processing enzyme)
VSTVARVRIRMYQVGFGDCFLLSLEYAEPLPDGRSERHMLIDYGSTRSAREHRARGRMSDVAQLIAEHTQGELDVVVLTHRHKDHLFGFADTTGAETIRDLKPKLVLRPWTEDPELPATADRPAVAVGPAVQTGADSAQFARSLSEAQDAVGLLAARPGLHAGLKAAAEDQLKNADAIAFLDELSANGRGRYLFAGADPDTTKVLPGLAITVLGPPTIEQDPRAAKQKDEDPQYWMLALRASLREAAAAATSRGPGAQPTVRVGPGPVRWLILRLAQQKIHSVARLVRKLDDALNNTSLILLIEVGNLTVLFPGDAQIENWQFTLDRLALEPELKKKLAAIDLYKVGHHGSRNATPRSLHALWVDRPDTLPRLTALMSTRPDVHGESEATAVPRATLVTALEQVASLISTDDLDQGEPFVEVVAETTGGPFARVQ